MERRLYRSRTDRVFFGVCGGLAQYFGIDSSIMRVIVVLLALASGIGVIVYFVMAFFVPLEGSQKSLPKDVVEENITEIRDAATGLGKEIKDAFTGRKADSAAEERARARRRNVFGVVLIIVGVILLLGVIGVFKWVLWSVIWPLALIALGVFIILSVWKK